MGKSNSTELKTVLVALPPGDKGPVCSYSPVCSPISSVWSEQTITVYESPLDVSTANKERAAMERWITQLVQRELAGDLAGAERRLSLTMRISLDAAAARVIKKALELRMRRLTRPRRVR